MFVVCYFFSGIGRLAGMIAVLTMIAVQNQQTYNFAAMANSYLYTLLGLAFVFAMSYMVRSPRPEKAVLHLVGRFFHSAELLISRMAREPGRTPALMERWKSAFYQHEMKTMPAEPRRRNRSCGRCATTPGSGARGSRRPFDTFPRTRRVNRPPTCRHGWRA
jgi:hypothetical protein